MKRFVLPLILLLAFALRVILIGRVPVGFTPDEASFGYDAYSILKTGKDQWGHTLPIVLESFGDFKAPLYAYLTIPSVAVFGLNPFAVRLPNALLGTLAVLVTYLLTFELFKKKGVALTAGFLLAISSWHVPLSRGAFEANLTTLILPLGIFLFLRKKYFLSGLVLGLNLFSYHSAKLVTPLIIIFLIIFFKKLNKVFLITFATFFALTLYTFFIGAGRRAADINIFRGSLLEAAEKRIAWINKGADPTFAHIICNKYTISLQRFGRNYSSYLSLRFLFSKGPAESTYGMLQGNGVLYLFEAIFILAYVFRIVNNGFKKEDKLLLFWLLIAPIPASLSTGVGYAANRVVVMLPAIQIISALGAIWLFQKKKWIPIIIGILILFQSFTYFNRYFGKGQEIIGKSMLQGNLEAMKFIDNNYRDEKVLVSTRLSEPQIYWAFANKIDPRIYQAESENWDYQKAKLLFLDQLPIYNLGWITFKRIDWKSDGKSYQVLVGRPEEFPTGIIPDRVIDSNIYVKTN